jgi:acyl-CoA synthetase (AMP-forming)/AMP-acid ligase II
VANGHALVYEGDRMDSATTTMWGLIAAAAAEHPERVLFSDRQGRSLTAGALRARSEEVAAGLGVEPGEVVSWQLPNGLDAILVMAALARVGAVQNPVIPILGERDVRLITEQVGTAIFIVPERSNDMARTLGVRVIPLNGPLPSGDPQALPPPPTDAGTCRWIYFSSGTTGTPKGARHTDASLIASSLSMTDRLGVQDGDLYPIAWPVTHIGGVSMTAAVLRAGGHLALLDRFDASTFGEQIAALHPTLMGSAVPFFRACLDAQRRRGDDPLYPELRACTAGGAATPPEIIAELVEAFGVPGVVNSWGLTEFPIASCPSPTDPPEKLARTVGPPSPGVEIRVVDGELRLKGAQCFLGYVDPAMDHAVFDEEGWFRTGDLGRIDDDGFVVITGRLKDVIIRNAENIAPAEVEEVLIRHPHIDDVAVIGLPDDRTGERVCAVVVAQPGRVPTLENVRQFCLAEGMTRQKVPEQLEVVPSIERNPMGKVVKSRLRDQLLDRMPPA